MGHVSFLLDKMGLDKMGLDKMGLDEMGLDEMGINPRSHPREEYNYYITCYLGNITTQERYVQHSYMLPRWFYHCVFNLGFYQYVRFMT